jgi:hypothetical protein
MPDTYDLSTDIGKVRLLIPDRNYLDPVFTDAEIDQFLSIEGANVKLAAALALEVAAADDAKTFKIMKTGQDSVDGVRGAELLMRRAKQFRESEIEVIEEYGTHIAIIEQGVGIFGARQRLWNDILRRQL